MKIFVICTVRKATKEYLKMLYDYVVKLENEGHEVHLPPRDTNQEDEETGGYRICGDNKDAILWADEIHISYNESSTGTHFDLGMAFMADKKIHIFDCPSIDENIPKSFPKMMRYWENYNLKDPNWHFSKKVLESKIFKKNRTNSDACLGIGDYISGEKNNEENN